MHLLLEILGNRCIVIICCWVSDIVDFGINLNLLIKLFSDIIKESSQNVLKKCFLLFWIPYINYTNIVTLLIEDNQSFGRNQKTKIDIFMWHTKLTYKLTNISYMLSFPEWRWELERRIFSPISSKFVFSSTRNFSIIQGHSILVSIEGLAQHLAILSFKKRSVNYTYFRHVRNLYQYWYLKKFSVLTLVECSVSTIRHFFSIF